MSIVLVSLAGYFPFAPVRFYDFRAFYCAGKAIDVHADPYREHPLHECERETKAPGMPDEADDITVPAPFPGYVLALFALLALLPFGICALLWIVASIAAVGITIRLLQRVIDLPVATIAVALFLPVAVVAIPLGQLAPFVGCGIAVCAHALKHGRWRLAAGAALATSLDPAVALVLCATLVLTVPPSRATIVIGTAALCTVSLVMLGVDTNLEYIWQVMHAHAIGNIAERSQFSTAHFAWVVGAGRHIALAVGEIWYGLAAAVGIWIAGRLRRTYGVIAVALVPPAFAVFGGLYVHFSQLALAIPAYLMAAQQTRWQQPLMAAAIFFLAVPWLALSAFPPFAIALVVLAIVYAGAAGDARPGLGLGLSAAALLVAFFCVGLLNSHAPSAAFHVPVAQNPLSETSWSRYVEWRDPSPNLAFLLLQIPTVAAFSVCLAVLSRGAFVPADSSAQSAVHLSAENKKCGLRGSSGGGS